MCGVSRLSPVRAKKKDFVGAAVASSSGAALWAKLVTAQPKQSSPAKFTARKNTFKAMKLLRCVDERNDTSFVLFCGSAGTQKGINPDELSPRNCPCMRYRRIAK